MTGDVLVGVDPRARLDLSGAYRYTLTREVGPAAGGRVVFIMLNPSTADAEVDDPTIRRCIGFARTWGFGTLTVVNLFALRATNPRELLRHEFPDGMDNDRWTTWAIERADCIVCAWGALAKPLRHRARATEAWLRGLGKWTYCLGHTKDGEPRHPLYVRADTERRIHPAPPLCEPTNIEAGRVPARE